MAISVQNLFRERKYPFIFALSFLFLCVIFFLVSDTEHSTYFTSTFISQLQQQRPAPTVSSFSSPPPPSITTASPTSLEQKTETIPTLESPPPPPAPSPPLLRDDREASPVAVPDSQEDQASTASNYDEFLNLKWKLCPGGEAAVDYIPCLDNWQAIKALKSKKRMEHRERHCPKPNPRCLVPLPVGYKIPVRWPKSRDMIWYANVPHPKLVEYKKNQNWVRKSGKYLVFPGGGTQFKHGVDHYVNFIEKSVSAIAWGKKIRVVLDVGCGVASFGGYLLNRNVITMSFAPKDEHEAQIQFALERGIPATLASVSAIAWGKKIRVVLDVGCGVASFGGYLLNRNVITMSFAPKDEHEAQIQFALERGIPATLAVIGTQKLTFPDNSFDLLHCARCRVHWHGDGGKPLLELNRVLRPGGFFIWSATPVYQTDEAHQSVWRAMVALTEAICWKVVVKKKDSMGIGLVIYQKPISSSCYEKRKEKDPPMCDEMSRNVTWYSRLERCLPLIPPYGRTWPPSWPERLTSIPLSLTQDSHSADLFTSDTKHWASMVSDVYLDTLGIKWSGVRNVMDLNAHYGGFAAALKDKPIWVMNVVPIHEEDTLPVIYSRGLIGIYHDWCEPFNTYPRSYDLLHSAFLFDNLMGRCDVIEVAAEMDRVLRPGGWILIQDTKEIMYMLSAIFRSLHWNVNVHKDLYLVGSKGFWRPDGGRVQRR